MVKKLPQKGIQFIDFLQFVEKHCCKEYSLSLEMYNLTNDVTNKDVKTIFYHNIIKCIMTYFVEHKTFDKRVFYIHKKELPNCCLIGNNDVNTFLKFLIAFIKHLKTNLNLPFICCDLPLKMFADSLDMDAVNQELLAVALKIKEVKSEKVYRFLNKHGLKHLSSIYKTDAKVKFWLK
jgi:hypothetical protein